MPEPVEIGVIAHGRSDADLLFNQCDGPAGRHRELVLRPMDARAPRLFVFAPPVGPDSRPKPRSPLTRFVARRRGVWDAVWADHAWDRLGREPADVTALVYEPPDFGYSDAWWAGLRRRAGRSFGTDRRAAERVRLPAMWSFDWPVEVLQREPPPGAFADRPLPLVTVTSGMARLGGHRRRLAFLEMLRGRGVALSLYGRRLPAALGPLGPVASKASVLRAARWALVIENSTEGDLYVSEKIWDALACWAVPIYFGSAAVDRMIPPESFVRLSNLDEAAADSVASLIGDEAAWRSRLEAMAAAREAMLGPLRLVEWLRAVTLGEPADARLRP